MRDRLLEHPVIYLAWQAPFAAQKIRPMLAAVPAIASASLLDVGCGPGTNRKHLPASEYVGVDLNASYIKWAKGRYEGTFIAGDAASALPIGRHFDLVLMNSLLHHLDDPTAVQVLNEVAARVSPTGSVHIIDLIMPDKRSTARMLARMDRGHFARSFDHWRELFEEEFETITVQRFQVGIFGFALWHMIYFHGKIR